MHCGGPRWLRLSRHKQRRERPFSYYLVMVTEEEEAPAGPLRLQLQFELIEALLPKNWFGLW